MKLHFKLEDHWDTYFQMINQNLGAKAGIPCQGDLMETTGLLLWYLSLQESIPTVYKDIVDGIMAMYEGVNGQLVPRTKAFTNDVPKTEPDRWVNLNGIYYRALDVSDSQLWYIWMGLKKIAERTGYIPAKQLTKGIANRVVDNGFKIKWDKKVTKNGSFVPTFWDSSQLRGMVMAREVNKNPHWSMRPALWCFSWWTKLYAKLGKYNETDAFNSCMALWALGEDKKLKKHIEDWSDMVKLLGENYRDNKVGNSDIMQDDLKWALLREMMA